MKLKAAEQTILISPTGFMSINLTPSPLKSYVGKFFSLTIAWAIDSSPVGLGNVSVKWGDASTSVFTNITSGTIPPGCSHAYTTAATFTITVDLYDQNSGLSGTKTTTVQVAALLTQTFTSDKTTGLVPLAIAFTCLPQGGYLNYTWTLDPGDGDPIYSGTRTAGGSFTQIHTYNKPGTWTARMNVTDSLGVTSIYAIDLVSGIVSWINNLSNAQKAVLVVTAIAGVGSAAYAIKRRKRSRY